MCYSEELKREAGGFMVGDQWVLTGWKGMYVENAKVKEVSLRHESPQYRFILSPSTGFEWEKTEAEPHVTYTKSQAIVPEFGKVPRFYSMFSAEYTYEFGKVMTDNHGFHLAATLDGAKGAVYPSDKTVYTKILALESAIEDNHAHVVMVLEPGKEPTEEQIAAVAKGKFRMRKASGRGGAVGVPAVQTPYAVYSSPGQVLYATSAVSYVPFASMNSATSFSVTNASGIWVDAAEIEDES